MASDLRSLGLDVVRAGFEVGGERFDPDLFVRPGNQLGFYLEIKTPQRERIAIDIDEWLRFRILGDVLVLAVWSSGGAAIIDIERDRPAFWGAAETDSIPVLAARDLHALDVPLRLYEPGDPSYTSNKPFVVFGPRRVYRSVEQALSAVLRKAGVSP